MAQNFVSVAGQGVGQTGMCVLSWNDGLGLNTASVSFLPTMVRIPQHQFAPLQKVNIAINGTVHVFQYGTQEPLTWTLTFTDLPYDVQASRTLAVTGRGTDGFLDLLSFVRITLNYSQQTFTVLHPDGLVEQVRYLRGLEQFQEVGGQTNRAQFWTGQLVVTRVVI